jgi:hypothetical protein
MREVGCSNPDCRATNRVPSYSITKIPRCGVCRSALPESRARTFARNIFRWRGCIFVAGVGGLILSASWDQLRVILAEALNPPPACRPQSLPQQGTYAVYETSPRESPLTIKTSPGSNYFVKLQDVLTERPIISFFIRNGLPLDEDVPTGNFLLKYASGNAWCNDRDLFGPETLTQQADKTFLFARDNHWDLELIKQRNGNLSTHSIPRNKF